MSSLLSGVVCLTLRHSVLLLLFSRVVKASLFINIRRIASNNNIAPADADEIEATMQQQKLMKKMKSM